MPNRVSPDTEKCCPLQKHFKFNRHEKISVDSNFVFFFAVSGWTQQQHPALLAEQEISLKYGAERLGKRKDAAMQKFRDNRLGLFIHWELYAITGGEWEGKVYGGPSSFLQKSAKITPQEWMTLIDKWNPTKFNASEWAKLVKSMGVKYVKIVTKHHDEFCLWPSKYSEYTVAQTPNKKDVLGELVKAFDAAGIDVHLYSTATAI